MADYDFSKPAPNGSGMGGIGLAVVGAVIVLAVLYAVFGGAGISRDQSPANAAIPEAAAPADAGIEATPVAPVPPAQ